MNKAANINLILENLHRAWKKFDFTKKGKISELATKRRIEIKTNVDTYR